MNLKNLLNIQTSLMKEKSQIFGRPLFCFCSIIYIYIYTHVQDDYLYMKHRLMIRSSNHYRAAEHFTYRMRSFTSNFMPRNVSDR